MVSFTHGMPVKGLEVDRSSWFTRLFSSDNHATAPGDRGSFWHWFDDTKLDISIQSFLYLLLPVYCNWYGGVMSHGCSIFVHLDSHGLSWHHGEWLVLAHVENTCAVVVYKPFFQLLSVFFGWREWDCGRLWWGFFSFWAVTASCAF